MSIDKEQFMASLQKYMEECGVFGEYPECQSPIECMLYRALYVYAGLAGYELDVQPQKQIGEYRVDFWVELRRHRGVGFRGLNGELQTPQVVVECDGHEFHERTKEQAGRDKRRDRILLGMGHRVLHFTGSDIWKDVFACAREIVNFLLKDYMRQFEDGENER